MCKLIIFSPLVQQSGDYTLSLRRFMYAGMTYYVLNNAGGIFILCVALSLTIYGFIKITYNRYNYRIMIDSLSQYLKYSWISWSSHTSSDSMKSSYWTYWWVVYITSISNPWTLIGIKLIQSSPSYCWHLYVTPKLYNSHIPNHSSVDHPIQGEVRNPGWSCNHVRDPDRWHARWYAVEKGIHHATRFHQEADHSVRLNLCELRCAISDPHDPHTQSAHIGLAVGAQDLRRSTHHLQGGRDRSITHGSPCSGPGT